LRGLQVGLQTGNEAKDATKLIKDTVLGLNSQVSAQRLARLLLADPLGAEEQWEKALETSDESGRAVLLK
jgi:hypothetical protein